MHFYHLQSHKTKSQVSERESYTVDKAGNPLDVAYDYGYIKAKLNLYDLKHTPISHLKYLDFYPIADRSQVVTKEEGNTPLYHLKNIGKAFGCASLYLKNEGMNPTGVFKDRGTMVEITKARELGAKAVCVASTGNMAASVSAYAAQAGLPCYVLVPEGTPVGKLAQTLSYGARVLQIRGTYDDCVKLVRQMSEKYGFFLCGDYAFRREGQKSIAYEIIEQLGWRAPDALICPVGFGTNLAGIYKGFVEFKRLGFIERLPKIIGVQAAGCAPLARAWKEGKRTYRVVEKPDTLAGAVAVGNPCDAPFIFDAVATTGGCLLSYIDDEILEAQTLLGGKESVFVEPASALPLAALKDFSARKDLSRKIFGGSGFRDKSIVLIGTGNGLKDPRALLKRVPTPPTVDPDIHEVDRFLRFKLYKLRTGVSVKERERIVIDGTHITTKELHTILKEQFDLRLPILYLKDMLREVEIFLKKGKPVTRIDLQRIAEDTLKERAAKKVLEFVDFRVQTSRNERAEASVVVRYKARAFEGSAEGVGPFDAVINAFKEAIGEKVFELADYVVEIDAAKTDATVKVTMTMGDDKGNKVIGTGTSPDIIVASVLAYEEAFNLLCV